jgi:integrase
MEIKRIRVIVFRPAGREFYQAEWTDPVTGRQKRRSMKTNVKRDAERIAGNLERQLNDGTYHSPRHVEWATFRKRYEEEILPGLADATAKKARSTFNAIETHLRPKLLAGVNAEHLSKLSKRLRQAERSENTIKSHLSHLRAALKWAKRIGMLIDVPQFDMPKRTKTARHRSVTLEEFERMLSKIGDVVGNKASEKKGPGIRKAKPGDTATETTRIESWRFFLCGLWASGLRLGEAMNLTWDNDRKLKVQMTGRFPMLWIPAELQKNHRNGLIPVSPEFVELLRTIPESARTGFVFNPQRSDWHESCGRIGQQQASKQDDRRHRRKGASRRVL